MDIKHGGCFFCGNMKEQLLKSVVKHVIHRNGREDHAQAVALCSQCVKMPTIDLRVQPKD